MVFPRCGMAMWLGALEPGRPPPHRPVDKCTQAGSAAEQSLHRGLNHQLMNREALAISTAQRSWQSVMHPVARS